MTRRGLSPPRRGGLSLAEVIVSVSIFLAISALVVVIMRVGRRSETKGDVHSQADRAVLTAMSKIRAELQGGVVLGAIPAFEGQPGQLRYLFIEPRNPESIDFTGHPAYQGPVTITREGTQLLRLEERPGGGEDVRLLEDLGEGGEVSFQMMNNRLLWVEMTATRPDPTNQGRLVRYGQEMKLYMHNQP